MQVTWLKGRRRLFVVFVMTLNALSSVCMCCVVPTVTGGCFVLCCSCLTVGATRSKLQL